MGNVKTSAHVTTPWPERLSSPLNRFAFMQRPQPEVQDEIPQTALGQEAKRKAAKRRGKRKRQKARQQKARGGEDTRLKKSVADSAVAGLAAGIQPEKTADEGAALDTINVPELQNSDFLQHWF